MATYQKLKKKQRQCYLKTLNWSAEQLNSGLRDFDDICRQAKQQLEQAGLKIDYFEIAQRDTLKKATLNDSQLVILAAAFLGPVRLIDNLLVDIT